MIAIEGRSGCYAANNARARFHPGTVLVRLCGGGDACALDRGRNHHRLEAHPAIAWFKDPAGNILSVLGATTT
jgi:hypothetical protein